MQKPYKTYVLIILSTISISLAGMNKSNDDNIWTLKPLGGYIVLHSHRKEDMCKLYNVDKNDNVEKAVHFTLVDTSNQNHPVYQYLKYRSAGSAPLNLFTEKGKSFTITTQDTGTFTVVSDDLYNEEKFDSYSDYWTNIHSKKYSYEEYLKKIRSNQ